MKIVKNTLSFIILSLLFIALFLSGLFLYDSTKQDEVDPPNEKVESTQTNQSTESQQKTYTESPVQPIRKTYDEDYALRLMSVPRKNITDINVVNDYDSTLSKLQYNVNNNVATFKDKEILRVYYNIQEEQNND